MKIEILIDSKFFYFLEDHFSLLFQQVVSNLRGNSDALWVADWIDEAWKILSKSILGHLPSYKMFFERTLILQYEHTELGPLDLG